MTTMTMEIIYVDTDLKEILKAAYENNVYFDGFEGCLQDNYIFYDAEKIMLDGKSSKYIIAKEKYLNEWSSGHVFIMTNSDEVMEKYQSEFELMLENL